MNRFLLPTALCCLLISGPLCAQNADLASSYYHFSLAKLYDLREDYARAIYEFERAIALNSENSQLRVEFAKTLFQAGRIERALEECGRAIELDPNNSSPHLLLGQIYVELENVGQSGTLERAVREFERVVELDSSHFEANFMLGRLYLFHQEYEKAAEAFSRAIEVRPGVIQSYEHKASALQGLERLAEAIEVLEEALLFDDTSPGTLLLLGQMYESTQQFDRAVESYLQFRRHHTMDQATLSKLGMLLLRHGPLEEAAKVLEELSSRFPEFLPGRVQLAGALRELERFPEAEKVLDEVLEHSPAFVPARLELGKLYRDQRRYDQAARAFRGVLDREPENLEAAFELARAHSAMGERSLAVEQFQDLLERVESPHQRNLFSTHLALVHLEQREFDRGVELLRTVARESGGDLFAELRLADALRRAERIEEALKLTEALHQRFPDEDYVVITHAQVLASAGESAKADRLLEEASGKRGDQERRERFFLVSSQIHMDRKEFSVAEDVIRAALQELPDSDALQFRLAAALERQERYDLAEETFQEILRDNPDHAGVLNYLGYMLADRGVRLEEALGYIKRAVEIDPFNGAYLDSLGWVYFRLDQLDLAETHLVEAARISEGDPTIYDHLGDLYRRLGDLEKARRFYEKSVTFGENEKEVQKVREKLQDLDRLLSRDDR